jgi:hypothetical protein
LRSRDRANAFEASREVLRQKRLRMTELQRFSKNLSS